MLIGGYSREDSGRSVVDVRTSNFEANKKNLMDQLNEPNPLNISLKE